MTRRLLLSKTMRECIWTMLEYQRNPRGMLLIDERTANALVRRGIMTKTKEGYILDESAARKALLNP